MFQCVVTDDWADIALNAGLQEWMEIFVVLCTSAKGDEFAGQVEQLGQWLEFDGTLRRSTECDGFSKNDTLTQLAGGKPRNGHFLD